MTGFVRFPIGTVMNASANQQTADLVQAIATVLADDQRTPRYELVTQAIEREIRAGRLTRGTALPTEPELANLLSISRQTIRHALHDLTQQGLLVRRRGVGTFVTGKAIEQPLGELSSFLHTLATDGSPPGAQLLGVRLAVDDEASPLLRGDARGLVCEISRLFSVDGEPVVLERIFLDPAISQLLPGDRLANAVIDDLLREVAGVSVDRGTEVVQITRPTREEAVLLDQRRNDPLFLITRFGYAADVPVELRRSLVRGDRARFRIELKGAPLAPIAGGGSITFERDE